MRKTLSVTVLVFGVLLALVVIREAFFSYTSYFVIVPWAKLYVDGKSVSGWLHKGGRARSYILTRSVIDLRESYWITTPDVKGGRISSCGDWAAPRSPVIAIGDVNPPCLSFAIAEHQAPRESVERKATFGPKFVEFTADDGSRVRASW